MRSTEALSPQAPRDTFSEDFIPVMEREGVIPGRGVVRVSLTPICNLRCGHCHNEGQAAPWLHKPTAMTIADIDALIRMASKYGAKAIRFTGGEPGMFPHFCELLDALENWRSDLTSIGKWGLTTNGIPFLDSRKFSRLARSALTHIAVGVDSVEPGELSRPNSPVGIPGAEVFTRFIQPLSREFPGQIKINVVFAGNQYRTRRVIDRARSLGLNVTVLELNGVMGRTHDTRAAFERLREDIAKDYVLTPRLCEELNEVYLYDSYGREVIKFYQDHCADRECNVCRKLDFRIVQAKGGLAAVPCYEQAQQRVIPLMLNGSLSESQLQDAIRYNGRGPDWFKCAPYTQSRKP
jgi:molybdenum cofactor biosynthesis enzyme MoaA